MLDLRDTRDWYFGFLLRPSGFVLIPVDDFRGINKVSRMHPLHRKADIDQLRHRAMVCVNKWHSFIIVRG